MRQRHVTLTPVAPLLQAATLKADTPVQKAAVLEGSHTTVTAGRRPEGLNLTPHQLSLFRKSGVFSLKLLFPDQ